MIPLRFRDVCKKIGSGATPRGGKDVYLETGEVALIRSQNVHNDRFERTGLVYIGQEHSDQLRNVEVQGKDILLNITGDSVARVCQVPADVLPARVNQHVAIIRPDPCRLDPRFLRFFLATPQMQAEMLALAAAGATRNALTKEMIEGFEVPDLSVEVQRAIAALLGALEDKIELNRRTNETLEAMGRAIFKDWFVDFGPTRAKAEGRAPYLTPELWDLFPDALDPSGKPVGWCEESVHTQAQWVNGAAYKNMHFTDALDALPVIKIAELKAGVTKNTKFTNTALGRKYRISDGELLFSWSGNPDTSIDTFIWTGGDAWLNQHIFAVRQNGKRSTNFLYSMLKSLKSEFTEIARNKQTTGLGHVTQQDLKRLTVCTGNSDILAAFDEVAEPVYSLIYANLRQKTHLTQTRDFLLPRLISGEIRLSDTKQTAENVA